MTIAKVSKMTNKDFDLKGPNGEVLYLENVASIRGIRLNRLENTEETYFVDLVDVNGNEKNNYTCSYGCLNMAIIMLFAEGEAEDKTTVSVSFESLVALMAVSRNMGYDDAVGLAAGLGGFTEEPDEEFAKKEPTAMLH